MKRQLESKYKKLVDYINSNEQFQEFLNQYSKFTADMFEKMEA